MSDDLPDRRRKKPWRAEMFIGFGLLLVVSAIGWGRTSNIAEDAKQTAIDVQTLAHANRQFVQALRDSTVAGCRRQNRVRKRQHEVQNVVRYILKKQNQSSRDLTPADFPGFDPARFRELVKQGIKRNQHARQDLNHQLPLAPCQKAYPQEGDPK